MTQPLGIVRGAALIGAVLVVVVAGCGRSSGDEKSEGKGASHSTLVTSATGVAQPDSTGESKAPAPPVPPSAMDVTSTRPATSSPPASVDLIATAVAEAQAWPMRTKLAQLMFIGFNTGYRDTPGTSEPSAAQDVIDAGVGGVFVGRKELDLFNSPVFPQAQSGPLPLLVATDGEGGRVDPLPQVATPLPPAREMAAWDSAKIRKEASSHGAELRAHGVNVNFAPMLDLAGGADALGDRTWSSDPSQVTRTAGAFSEGMCDAGVYPTFKHFPGHGRSDFDADLQPAATPDIASLESADLLPFRELIKSMAGRSLVMTGHLDVPGLTSEGRPVSLDPVAMRFLREDVGIDGVAIPDELAEMGSITDRGIPVAEAIEQSIVAGNDMALFFGGPADLAAVLDHLEGAVEAGRLSPARVDDSIRRVVTLKSSGACSA